MKNLFAIYCLVLALIMPCAAFAASSFSQSVNDCESVAPKKKKTTTATSTKKSAAKTNKTSTTKASSNKKSNTANKNSATKKAAYTKKSVQSKSTATSKKTTTAKKTVNSKKTSTGTKGTSAKKTTVVKKAVGNVNTVNKQKNTNAAQQSKTTATSAKTGSDTVNNKGNKSEAVPEKPQTEFEKAKGEMLFPVAGTYSIYRKYGTSANTKHSKVTYNNKGIDIKVPSAKRTNARAVTNGEVFEVYNIDGYNYVVILKHDDYYTVYANLDSVSIKPGDKVETGRVIGNVAHDKKNGNISVLHFEVRKGTRALNPLDWVAQ